MRTEAQIWDRWAPWILGVLTLAVGLSIWRWYPPGIWHDDGVYALLGKSLANGHGLRYSGVAGAFLAPKFPPLFPAVLAILWSMAPGFPGNVVLLSSANLVFMALAASVFVAYGRRVLGMPLPWLLGAAALAWISPAFWRVAMVPLSEPLFVLFSLLALWAGGRLEQRGEGRDLVLFLVFATAAFHTRTMGVVLILGLAGALLLRNSRKKALLVLLFSGVLALPWTLWSWTAARHIPGPLSDTLGPYGGWLLREVSRSPGHYLSFLPDNALHVVGRAVSLLLPGVAGPALWLGLLLLPVLCLGLWTLGRESRMVPLTVAFYGLVLLLWPFQDVRLMVPLIPLLFLGMSAGIRALLPSEGPWTRARVLVALVGGAWLLAASSFSALRLVDGWPGEVYEVRSEILLRAVNAVQEKTPSEAVIGAPELWSGIHLYTGRLVSPSARFLPLSTHGPSWGEPREQYELWIEAGITHLLVEHGGEVHGGALDRMDALCAPGTVQLLDLQPGQFLVGLNWDERCRRVLVDPGL